MTQAPVVYLCCRNHDGPHLHGCTLHRDAQGREHQGECVRAS